MKKCIDCQKTLAEMNRKKRCFICEARENDRLIQEAMKPKKKKP